MVYSNYHKNVRTLLPTNLRAGHLCFMGIFNSPYVLIVLLLLIQGEEMPKIAYNFRKLHLITLLEKNQAVFLMKIIIQTFLYIGFPYSFYFLIILASPQSLTADISSVIVSLNYSIWKSRNLVNNGKMYFIFPVFCFLCLQHSS